MKSNQAEAPVQKDIDELRKGASSQADLVVLDQWQKETDAERQQAVRDLPDRQRELALLPDGQIVAAHEAREQLVSGHISHPYGNAGRRA